MKNPLRLLAERFANQTGGSMPYHSLSYHQHFEGYSERKVIDGRGKSRIQRIYTGPYYLQEENETCRTRKKIVLLSAFAGAAGLLFAASCTKTTLNSTALGAFLQLLDILCLMRILYALILRLAAPAKMDVGTWRGASLPLIRWGRISFAVCAILSVFGLLYAVILQGGVQQPQLLCSAGFILSGVCSWILSLTECRTQYKKVQNNVDTSNAWTEIER